jgi:hypothetical protein
MVDGYSTGQGLGMGLSGARRMVVEKWGAAHPDHL